MANHRLTMSIRSQIDSFLEGLHELVPKDLLSIFDENELELIVSGMPTIDRMCLGPGNAEMLFLGPPFAHPWEGTWPMRPRRHAVTPL